MTPTTAAAASTPWWLTPAVLAAVIAAFVAVATFIVNGRRARVDRQRVLFAEAVGDLAAYREFVYIVRRRRGDEPAAERVRISSELSEVQRKLNQHSAVLKVEAPRVAVAFDELLRITRRIAGGAIRDGWNTDPITEDRAIHIDIDLTAIDPHERAYLTEVADHLSAIPTLARGTLRSIGDAWDRRRARRDAPHATSAAEPLA